MDAALRAPARAPCRWDRRALLLAFAVVLIPGTALAHDPSAWGGLFRTRDAGVTWRGLDSGSFVSGAVTLAISPADPNHLLLGTDSGLSRSPNGGRNWRVEAPNVLGGPVFAVVLDADGKRALASGAGGLFRSDGDRWRAISAPSRAAPARALARGGAPGRVYLSGWNGLHVSDDWGASWTRIGAALPAEHVDALVVSSGPPETVYAIAAGQLWLGVDGGRSWQPRTAGSPAGHVEAIALDGADPARVWALVGGQLYRIDDRGDRWRAVGRPVPEPDVRVRGMAIADGTIVLATDRGVLRSADGGERWLAMRDGLPAHLEAGPIVRDPHDPSTIYVGFALTPYAELWRRAADGRTVLEELELHQIAGSVAFLALLILCAAAMIRRLAAHYRVPRPARSDTAVTHAAPPRNAS